MLGKTIVPKSLLQRMLYAAGIAITLACACYVLFAVVRNEVWRLDSKLLYSVARWMPVASLIYGVTSLFLGAAWWRLLRWTGETVTAHRVCHGIYGRSQLAKYLPGNVFSLVGRQVLGRQAGFSHLGLATASILEIVGQLIAAGAIILISSRFAEVPVSDIRSPIMSYGTAGVVVVVALALFLVRRFSNKQEQIFRRHTVGDFVQLTVIFCLYLPFFLVCGTVLWVIVEFLAGDRSVGWTYVLSIGTTAWILGFVVPGAPGGVGVRDALLIAGLTPVVGGPVATIAAIAYRIVTISGDIIYFLISCAFSARVGDDPE